MLPHLSSQPGGVKGWGHQLRPRAKALCPKSTPEGPPRCPCRSTDSLGEGCEAMRCPLGGQGCLVLWQPSRSPGPQAVPPLRLPLLSQRPGSPGLVLPQGPPEGAFSLRSQRPQRSGPHTQPEPSFQGTASGSSGALCPGSRASLSGSLSAPPSPPAPGLLPSLPHVPSTPGPRLPLPPQSTPSSSPAPTLSARRPPRSLRLGPGVLSGFLFRAAPPPFRLRVRSQAKVTGSVPCWEKQLELPTRRLCEEVAGVGGWGGVEDKPWFPGERTLLPGLGAGLGGA